MSSRTISNFYIESPISGTKEEIVSWLKTVISDIERDCIGGPISGKCDPDDIYQPYWFLDERNEDELMTSGEDTIRLSDGFYVGNCWWRKPSESVNNHQWLKRKNKGID